MKQTVSLPLILLASVVGLCFGILARPAIAQSSAAQTATDEEIDDLRRDLDIVELRRRILENSLPAQGNASQPLSGRTEVDGISLESRILAYDALQVVSVGLKQTLLNEVQDLSTLVIFNDTAMNDVTLYQTYANLYDMLAEDYETLLAPQRESFLGPSALFAPTAVLRTSLDFLSFFRTDTAIRNADLNIQQDALIAQLTRAFNADVPRRVEVFYPLLYRGNLSGAILEQVERLVEQRGRAAAKLSDPTLSPQLKAQLLYLNQQTDEFLKGVSSNLLNLGRGARVNQLLSRPGSYVLYARVEAGGSDRTRRNLFTGARLRHSGGVIINYLVLTPEGDIRRSDTLYYYTGYRRVDSDDPVTNIPPEFLDEQTNP